MEKDGFFSEPIEFFLGHIPFIITDLIAQLIKTKGQNSKILFNSELANDELDKIITELKSKRITDWSDYNNPATLSSSLLIYISSLFHDEPLITEDVQEYLLSTQITNSTSYLLLLRKILLKLYIGRFQTLSYLIDFLNQTHFLSNDQLFKIFSIPFFGKKSLNLNNSFLNQLFQLFLNSYSTIFQNSITKESFLTDEQIDLLIDKHNKGESVKTIHKEGNLTPKLIGQDELERIINDDNSNITNDTMNQHQNKKIKKKNKKVNANENLNSVQQNHLKNLYKDTITQTDCKKLSFSDNFVFEIKEKTKKRKKEKSNSNNNKKENSSSTQKRSQISLQINKSFVFESVKHNKNHSSSENFSDFESFHDSSSKTNSESISSSATSSTTSSYSFYSFSHLDVHLNKYSQTASSTIQIRDCIPNSTDNIQINTNTKANTKVKKNKKNRNVKDRSDTSDNVSYSDNIPNNNNNNCEKIPEPPIILDYLNSDQHRKKTNYAKNHNYNNYLYTDNSSDNTTNNYSENRDNDKSDSQNGIEIKFDFYKNLVNTNSIEVLPPAPMLDPALLTSPIFGDSSNISLNYNQENCYKNEINNIQSDRITKENTSEDENSKHVSFQYQSGSNTVKASNKNRAENSSSNSIEESESSLASSCKKEEEDKKEFSDEEEETKKEDNKNEKKPFLYKYFKRKNEKKKKDKINKEKSLDEEKKPKADKKYKKDKKDKSDKKSKKK